MRGLKKIAILIVACLFVYLSLFTWNLRTGHLDALSSHTGLDISGIVLKPGIWIAEQVSGFWHRYIYLVGLKQDNDQLRAEAAELRRTNMLMGAQARSAARLESLLDFRPPEKWTVSGARVIGQRMGPAGALDTVVVDKGKASGVTDDMPVVSLQGLAGRILRSGAATSTVLLLTDPNSRIAVIGANNRSPGMLSGQGYGEPLQLRYVNQNAAVDPGELLLSSGLSGIYPKGLPVAKVTKIRRSDISLFLTVQAEPLVDVAGLEEILLLSRVPEAAVEAGTGDAAASGAGADAEPEAGKEDANGAADQ
ncbi:rod shape-determining protein MreC [uncultured Pseudodesulfovibrio sp.]|uniref:rod shape-determining protein MreC n=1 Tax=uncultured Pseudodesulfovibrio sp. TaxID=2035858 RepID=UPI0029C79D05|nr:rod shape-determining protein MreC [uncultured Pseudodesulfovibrio sp.]